MNFSLSLSGWSTIYGTSWIKAKPKLKSIFEHEKSNIDTHTLIEAIRLHWNWTKNCTKCSVCKINQIICNGEKTFELLWTEHFLCQNIKFYDVPRSKVARLQFPFDHGTTPIFSQWCDFVCEALAICWMLLKSIRSMLFDSIIFQLLWHILLAMRMMPCNISLPKIQ